MISQSLRIIDAQLLLKILLGLLNFFERCQVYVEFSLGSILCQIPSIGILLPNRRFLDRKLNIFFLHLHHWLQTMLKGFTVISFKYTFRLFNFADIFITSLFNAVSGRLLLTYILFDFGLDSLVVFFFNDWHLWYFAYTLECQNKGLTWLA